MDGRIKYSPSQSGELEALDLEISKCFKCQPFVEGFQKPNRLVRGVQSKIMIVGQSPGKTELTSGAAFSGQSGRRLNEWLISSGADPSFPRRDIYCTSIVKCFAPHMKSFTLMTRNCRSFLFRQAQLVRPTLVITLGQKAYDELRLTPTIDLCITN